MCWSDPTEMFVRYRELTRGADSTVQEPRVLAPFYSKLDDMNDLFKRVWNHSNSWFNPGIIDMSYLLIYMALQPKNRICAFVIFRLQILYHLINSLSRVLS